MRGGDLEGLLEAHPVAVVPAARHPSSVAESERAYAAGHLAEAANAVAALARQQPADPTVLNFYIAMRVRCIVMKPLARKAIRYTKS